MAELNQYALSKTLGSKMRPIRAPRFGNFGLLESTAEVLMARELGDRHESGTEFSYAHDRLVAQAFEQVREGAPPDTILWNRPLARVFAHRCRELGLDAPDAVLNRRLLNIRKNKKRYERHGICLSPSTQRETHPSILPQHAHVIEFSLVRLRYRYGASIDDVLLDPALGDEFERLALEIAPQLSPQDLRLGALYIRKSRFLPKQEQSSLTKLDLAKIDHETKGPITLVEAKHEQWPDAPGLIELKEGSRYLYIARNENLQATIGQFVSGQAFAIMADEFWKPQFDSIQLQYVVGNLVAGVGIGKWELRLISDREPVFNWPIIHKDAP
jgi:hypothetical protein